MLLDCGATSLSALKRLGLDPGEIAAVFVSHLHGDHFGGLPFLILDGQFSRRTAPLAVVGTARHRPAPGRRHGVPVPRLVHHGPPVRRWTSPSCAPGPAAAVCRSRGHAPGRPITPAAPRPSSSAWTWPARSIAYTGDTAWTSTIADAAADADLLIAEGYYRDKNIPYHLRLADLDAHRDRLTAAARHHHPHVRRRARR